MTLTRDYRSTWVCTDTQNVGRMMLNSAIKLDTPSEWWKYETKIAETNITWKLLHGSIYAEATRDPTPYKAPVTPGLRPGYDLPATEKLVNRRKNVRLVAEVVRLVAVVVGDRKGQINRSKVVVMFKTQSHRAYDQVTTYLRSKNVAIVGKSKKELTTGHRDRTTGHRGRG